MTPSTENPFNLVKIALAVILFVAGAAATIVAVSGLEPVVDGVARVLQNVGLRRVGGGYSSIDALVAGGRFAAAAEAYAERGRDQRNQAEPGRAMRGLSRLLDRYPSNRRMRQIRAGLAELKATPFAAR